MKQNCRRFLSLLLVLSLVMIQAQPSAVFAALTDAAAGENTEIQTATEQPDEAIIEEPGSLTDSSEIEEPASSDIIVSPEDTDEPEDADDLSEPEVTGPSDEEETEDASVSENTVDEDEEGLPAQSYSDETPTLHFVSGSAEFLNPVPVVSGTTFKDAFSKLPESYADPLLGGFILNNWKVYEITGGTKNLVGTYDAYQVQTTDIAINNSYELVAKWTSSSFIYEIKYNLGGGKFKSEEADDVDYEFTVKSSDIALKNPIRKGYLFNGWYTDAAHTLKTASIPSGTYVNTPADGTDVSIYNLYADWTSATAPAVKLTSASYTKKGTVKFAFDKMEGAKRYEVAFSTSSSFAEKNTSTATVKKAGSFTVSNLLKKTYYIRVRAVTEDSTGATVNGAWSEVKSVAVKAGVKEVKAKVGKVKLKKVEIKGGELHVTAAAKKRLKSSDASYYLVTVDPATNKVLKKIATMHKSGSLEAYVPLYGSKGTNLIQGKFAIAVKNGKKYKRVSSAAFISNPEAAAEYKGAFPKVSSKKGLQNQGVIYDDLRIKHSFYNITVNQFIDIYKDKDNAYEYNGKVYYFNKEAIAGLGYSFSRNNAKGIVTTGQFMLNYPGPSYSYLIMKGARSSGHVYYAMNGTDKKARETYEALFDLLGKSWGTADCHLDNWIIGNECNIHHDWYYAGGNSRSKITKTYADMFKIVYYGAKSHYKNARVYICTDHTWIDRSGDWGAKPFMTSFNKEIKKRNKKIKWNLAYHAYPAILTQPATWNDAYTHNNVNSEFVTPKNLNILTNYVKKNFGKNCRIILSEQGFTATSGQDVQAAGILYTYYKAQFNSQIDAVIFRSLSDADIEVQQGLAFGIQGRKAYNVFKKMDSKDSVSVAKPYLKTIGASSWKKIIPGYKAKAFKKM
ncbi:MAG: InlB B-repeat-containing protein [Lachnospiraceae bacterium]|nr:InlB B-repeat-containing protein [Lachnospiraceae bacterium]